MSTETKKTSVEAKTDRSNCLLSHENGTCLSAGELCTDVDDEICAALHNAFESGRSCGALKSQEPSKLRVKINGGYLVAEKTLDPDFNGIYIDFVTDSGVAFSVAVAECKGNSNQIDVYCYEDVNTDEYTRKFTLDSDEMCVVSSETVNSDRDAASSDKQIEMEKLNEESSKSALRKDRIEKWQNMYFAESETMIALLENKEANELSKAEKEYLLEFAGDDEYAYVNDDGEIVLY